jgi:death-on-curing protein
MNSGISHPTTSVVLAIHAEVLAAHGGMEGIRDESLLDSAVAAPQATMMGQPVFADIVEIAAAYLFYLCRNHPFLDGNKRTALATSLVFLSENGALPDEQLDVDAWEALVFDIAASQIDREQTTERLKQLLEGNQLGSPP